MGRTTRAVRADMLERGNIVAWKEPMHEVRRSSGSRAVWKEPMYEERVRPQRNDGRKVVRKKKKARNKILRGIFLYFFLAGVVATCWVIYSFLFVVREKVHAMGAQENSTVEAGEKFLPEEGAESGGETPFVVTPEIRQECQSLYTGRESLLLLVNKEKELSDSYETKLRSICNGRLKAADILYDDLCAMLEAGGRSGYEYWISSAYRDRAYQQELVDEDVRKYMSKGYSYEAALQKTYEYTMPVGFSEHETGLALDILCSTNTLMDESQKSEPGNQWLLEHCHEFGFILRYPEGKEDVTGIGYEPWHFRYVGREAAAYIMQKGWTLEEFYGAL